MASRSPPAHTLTRPRRPCNRVRPHRACGQLRMTRRVVGRIVCCMATGRARRRLFLLFVAAMLAAGKKVAVLVVNRLGRDTASMRRTFSTTSSAPPDPLHVRTTTLASWHCSRCRSPTASTSRPSATARSGPTSRTSGTRAGCTASSTAARCGSRPRPAASTWSRSTRRSRPRSGACSGSPFDLAAFHAWAATADGLLGEIAARLAGFRPPLAPDPWEALVDVDHGAAGLAARPRSRSAAG